MTYGITPDEKYGYETNAAGSTARPRWSTPPTGSGHAVLIGFDAFYRAWKEQDERLVLNAALYPKGPDRWSGARRTAESARAGPDRGRAQRATAELPRPRPGRAGVKAPAISDRDLRIQVKRADAPSSRQRSRPPA